MVEIRDKGNGGRRKKGNGEGIICGRKGKDGWKEI
jgi:hypothetical protein